MTAATIYALAALITAVGGVIGLFIHVRRGGK